MADRGEKLQQPHCFHPFPDSRDTYLTKNYYENYSPKMVPTNPTGSWTNRQAYWFWQWHVIHCSWTWHIFMWLMNLPSWCSAMSYSSLKESRYYVDGLVQDCSILSIHKRPNTLITKLYWIFKYQFCGPCLFIIMTNLNLKCPEGFLPEKKTTNNHLLFNTTRHSLVLVAWRMIRPCRILCYILDLFGVIFIMGWKGLCLIHWVLVMHMHVSELGHHWFR